jgi:galactarate dehydratase
MVETGHILIKASEDDNVGIVVDPMGLQADEVVADGLKLLEYTPMGHKVALRAIPEGEAIIRYGQTIAYANKDLKAGAWVNELNVSLPEPPKLDLISIKENSFQEIEPLIGYTFEGYKNGDGSVGTKNVLGITTSVQCVAGLTGYAVAKIKKELLPSYPNVDDVVGLTHSYGPSGTSLPIPISAGKSWSLAWAVRNFGPKGSLPTREVGKKRIAISFTCKIKTFMALPIW